MNFFLRLFRRWKFCRTLSGDESVNVVDSMAKAKRLYKSLSAKVHPDKHPDHREQAEDLMQRITANKRNYQILLNIEREAKQILKI